jgi:hypothetical protein
MELTMQSEVAILFFVRIIICLYIKCKLSFVLNFKDAASGTSPDHAYGAHGIPLSYTVEMRGNGVYGNFGFVLPPSLIRPNAIEIVAGLKGMINEAKRLGYLGGQ